MKKENAAIEALKLIKDYDIKSYLKNGKLLLPQEIRTKIEAAILYQRTPEAEYLEQINILMWETWGVKDRKFDREEGDKIMEILNEWATNH